MWIGDTKACWNGLQNIKYTYVLLYVVEGRTHDVDTCTFNTCRRGWNHHPLEWNCERETFNTPSSPTLEPVRPENTKFKLWRNEKATTKKAIPNIHRVVQPTSACQNHHHHDRIDSSYQNGRIVHRTTILYINIFIFVDKLHSSFELMIRHESKTTTTM